MDQVEVYIVELELLKGYGERGLGVLDLGARDLGCYKELLTWNASLFDCVAEFGFVAID